MEPAATTANQQLEFELAVLRAVPGVLAAAAYPKKGFKPSNLNDNSIKLRLETDDGVKMVAKHCGAECHSWLEAARDVRTQLTLLVGSAAVAAAEERVRLGAGAAPAAPPAQAVTEAESEWLAAWLDEHVDPSTVTEEQLIAALVAHRSELAGRATAAKLTEAQVGTRVPMSNLPLPRAPRTLSLLIMCVCIERAVRARYRAADLRVNKATAERERLRALIPEEQPPRRSRQMSLPPSQSTGRCGFAWSATVTGAHALTAR